MNGAGEPIRSKMRLGIVIPALNEVETVGQVVDEVLNQTAGQVTRIIVVDNGSVDGTGDAALQAGAELVRAPDHGYGSACLAAIDFLRDWPDVLLFMDADGSSRAEEIPTLLAPIRDHAADLVIGWRPRRMAMTWPQYWGTQLAVRLIQLRWGKRFRDMGPFRAIRREAYLGLGMRDRTWGWTVEMQILAILKGLTIREVPVSWRSRRGGVSKISGTLSGVTRAGARICWTIARYSLRSPD